MQLPQTNSAYTKRVNFGRYVLGRLRRARLESLAHSVESTTSQVKKTGRAWEDCDELIQEALANRDAADDALDTTGKELRFRLASRSITAVKESPYKDIFPDGIEYYTAAPLDEEVMRYELLVTRVETHLSKDDDLRTSFVPILQEQIKGFQTAEAALNDANNKEAIARTTLNSAQDAWEDLMEKTFGALANLGDRAKAERYFPKTARTRTKPDASAA